MPNAPQHILIVEDDPGLAQLFGDKVRHPDCTTTPIGSARACIAWLETQTTDLMLLDYSLPDMLAPALVEELRKAGRLPPFIVITGHGDERVAVEMMKLGARDYLVKDTLLFDRLPTMVERTLKELTREHRLAESEAALRVETRRADQYFENAAVMMLVLDREGRVQRINPAGCEILGYPPAEIIGCNWFERFLSPAPRDRVRQTFEHLITGNFEQDRYVESPVFNRAGDERLLAWHNSVVRDAAGTIIGTLSSAEDITERRRTEEALRESEKHYRSLFDNMLNGYASCRMIFVGGKPVDFTYLAVNAAFETLTGLRNVVGRNVSEVVPGIRESDPELLATYGRVAQTGVPEQLEYHLASLHMWFALSVYSPRPDHFVAIFEVITERKRSEAQLRAQLAELKRWQAVMLNREDRMIVLKREVNALLQRLGEPVRYPSQALEGKGEP